MTEALDEYESDHPDLARCLAGGVDLRAGSFRHLCLKRLQLRNALQLVGLGDQTSSPLYAGRMDNPVARAEEARPATVGERGSGLPVRGGVAS
ncbi:hypothetical protein [Brachybacterium sp. P6-10-X1]|uniref:hypothetical protein n=1 Tax=Brachybacterium sp. P6-10-X1 TaxID=1903186 RepID=UPI001C12B4AF|nr:hypothetical protein [Brachybacterium sp. P6-10-X1]